MRLALLCLLGLAVAGCAGGEAAGLVDVATPVATSTRQQERGTAAAPTSTPSPAPRRPTATPTAIFSGIACEWAAVERVDDGDTLGVRLADGAEETVRLIGVDAPEGADALGGEATAALVRLAGSRACLEADTTDRDRIGRLLRYAWNEDGVLVNEALVEEGLALVVTFPPDTRYVQRYEAAQERARASGAGVWSAAPTPTPAGDGGQVQPLAGGDCDAAYPDFCIPPPSRVGDLDCGDVDGKRFRVLPPDPHGFDRDADGIGCES